MNQIKIEHLFSTPLLVFRTSVSDEFMEELQSDCYKWRDESSGLQKSNQNGWHSDTTIFSRPERTFRSVCKVFGQCVGEVAKATAPNVDLSGYDTTGEGWVNINYKGGYNVPHDHPGFVWSGVFYAKVPKTYTDTESRSGVLEFLDPRTNIAASGSVLTSTNYFSPKILIRPEEKMFVLFPSYLRHWVYPNEEDEDRISMAFNARYTKPKAHAENKS